MMVFAWCPLADPVGSVTFRQRKAQFGDGYAQVYGDGLNNRRRTWPLTFTGDGDDIGPIRDFLDLHSEGQRFLWQAPLDIARAYRVEGYSVQALGAGEYTLNVEFIEAG